MNENENKNENNLANLDQGSPSPTTQPPETSHFDIRSFNSYAKPAENAPHSEPQQQPQSFTVPTAYAQTPTAHQASPNGLPIAKIEGARTDINTSASAMPSPNASMLGSSSNINPGIPSSEPSIIPDVPDEKAFKKAVKKRFTIVALIVIALHLIFYFTAVVSINAYALLSGAETEVPAGISLMISALASAVCFPLGALMLSPIKSQKHTLEEKSKISPLKLLGFFSTTYMLMFAGSLVGRFINALIGALLGSVPSDIVAGGLEGAEIWQIIVFVCIFPGVFEELIFRKLLIDKTREFGGFAAVVFSALAFGLYHGNLEQFFYAFFIGLLFGFIYEKTGRIIYTIILHMLANFFGSAVSTMIGDNERLLALYSLFLLALSGVGLIYLIFVVIDNHSKFGKDIGFRTLGGGTLSSSVLLNAGTIIMLVFFGFEFVIMTLSTFGMI